MNITSSRFFDTTILGQPVSHLATLRTPAITVRKPRTGQAPEMSASLWRHTLTECEATRRHGVVARSLCGLLGVLSLGSVAVAAWQTHALLAGNRLHDAISMFLH